MLESSDMSKATCNIKKNGIGSKRLLIGSKIGLITVLVLSKNSVFWRKDYSSKMKNTIARIIVSMPNQEK